MSRALFSSASALLVIALSGDLPTGICRCRLRLPAEDCRRADHFFRLVLVLRAQESKAVRNAIVERRQACRAGGRDHRRCDRAVRIARLSHHQCAADLRAAGHHRAAPLLPAAVYSVGVVVTTYILFVYVLKTPLQAGPFGF